MKPVCRQRKRFWPKSTAGTRTHRRMLTGWFAVSLATAIHIMARRSMVIRGSRLTVQRHVAGGFTLGSSVPIKLTRQTHVIRKTIWVTAGASPGRAIAVLYITERARRQPASHGANARNWFGGTPRSGSG